MIPAEMPINWKSRLKKAIFYYGIKYLEENEKIKSFNKADLRKYMVSIKTDRKLNLLKDIFEVEICDILLNKENLTDDDDIEKGIPANNSISKYLEILKKEGYFKYTPETEARPMKEYLLNDKRKHEWSPFRKILVGLDTHKDTDDDNFEELEFVDVEYNPEIEELEIHEIEQTEKAINVIHKPNIPELDINDDFKGELMIPLDIEFLKTNSIIELKEKILDILFSENSARIIIVGESGIGKSHFLYELTIEIKNKINNEHLNYKIFNFMDIEEKRGDSRRSIEFHDSFLIRTDDLNIIDFNKSKFIRTFKNTKKGIFTCKSKDWLSLKNKVKEPRILEKKHGTIVLEYPELPDSEIFKIIDYVRSELEINFETLDVQKELQEKVGNNLMYAYTVLKEINKTRNKWLTSEYVKNLSGEVVIKILRNIESFLNSKNGLRKDRLKLLFCISRMKRKKIHHQHLEELVKIIIPNDSQPEDYPKIMEEFGIINRDNPDWIVIPFDMWYDFFDIEKLNSHIEILKEKEVNYDDIRELLTYKQTLYSVIDDLSGGDENIEEVINKKMESSCKIAINSVKRNLLDKSLIIGKVEIERLLKDYLNLLTEFFWKVWAYEWNINEFSKRKWGDVLQKFEKTIEESDINIKNSISDIHRTLILIVASQVMIEEYNDNPKMLKKIRKILMEIKPQSNDNYRFCGRIFLHLKKYNSALEEFNKAINKGAYPRTYIHSEYINGQKVLTERPNISPFYRNWYFKGLTLFHLGRFEESIKCYDEAIELHPSNRFPFLDKHMLSEIWLEKGISFARLERFDEEIIACEKALEIEPENERAKRYIRVTSYLRGIHGYGLGRDMDEIKYLDIFIKYHDKIDSFCCGVLFNKANELQKSGEYKKSLIYYEKILKYNPKDKRILYAKVKLLKGLKKKPEAQNLLLEIIKIDQELLQEGIELKKAGKKEEALIYFNKVDFSYKHIFEAQMLKAQIHLDSKKYSKAVESYNKAIEIRPNDPMLLFLKGGMCFQNKDIKQFEECFKKIWKLNPNFDEVLGKIYLDVKQTDNFNTLIFQIHTYQFWAEIANEHFYKKKSKQCYKKALIRCDRVLESKYNNSTPYYVDILIKKGRILFNLKRFLKACRCYDKIIEIEPENSLVWFFKGLAYLGLENSKQFEECIQKVWKLDPKFDDVFDEINTNFINKKTLNTEWLFIIEVYLSRIRKLLRTGERRKVKKYQNKAIEECNEIIKKAPDFGFIWYRKGTILWTMKQINEAGECYLKAFEYDPKLKKLTRQNIMKLVISPRKIISTIQLILKR